MELKFQRWIATKTVKSPKSLKIFLIVSLEYNPDNPVEGEENQQQTVASTAAPNQLLGTATYSNASAQAALPHEHPKRVVTATVDVSEAFARKLELAIQRSGTLPKLIEHEPKPNGSAIAEPVRRRI